MISKQRVRVSSFAMIITAGMVGRANAQCTPQWDESFGNSSIGPGEYVRGSLIFDDGSGPALFACGNFVTIGGTAARGIAKSHDGVHWEKLGEAMYYNGVHKFTSLRGFEEMAVFDPDQGGPLSPVLVACGSFQFANDGFTEVNNIAVWDGSTWSALGNGLTGGDLGTFGIKRVLALEVADLGFGPMLYAGGDFAVDGQPTADIAVWTGTAWASLGSNGVSSGSYINDIETHDDGSGPALYVSIEGNNAVIPGVPGTAHIARWDGETWSSVGGGMPEAISNSHVYTKLLSFDPDGAGGSPAKLLAFRLGGFLTPGAGWLDVWDGTSWTVLTIPYPVGGQNYQGISVVDDAAGRAVYFSGFVSSSGSHNGQIGQMIRFNGTAFSTVGPAYYTRQTLSEIDSVWSTMTLNTLDNPPTLFLGPGSPNIDSPQAGLVKMNVADQTYSNMRPVGGPTTNILDMADGTTTYSTSIDDIGSYDPDGAGPMPRSVVVVGSFYSMGQTVSDRIASYNGAGWSSVGGGIPDADVVESVMSVARPSGEDLYVSARSIQFLTDPDGNDIPVIRSGVFRLVNGVWEPLGARWNANWGTDIISADFGLGSQVYVIGNPTNGGTTRSLMRWDGSAWQQVGDATLNGELITMVSHSDASGPAIYVSSDFLKLDSAGSVYKGVMKWDGTTWTDVSAGLPTTGFPRPRLVVFNDELWGAISTTGSIDTIRSLYKWDGAAWVLQTMSSYPSVTRQQFLGVANDGTGDRFYFAVYEKVVSNEGVAIIDFDGTAWNTHPEMGRMSSDWPTKVLGMNTGGDNALWFIGYFHGVGGEYTPDTKHTINVVTEASSIARWYCPVPPCPADFDNSGNVTVQDIFDFLAAWFSGNSSADINHVGGVTVQDIFDFLSAWFSGC